MQLTERQFPDRALTVVRIAEDPAAAFLELHHTYFTYYWRCLFGPDEFVHRIERRQDVMSSNLTIVGTSGEVRQMSVTEAEKDVFPKESEEDWMLLRFDGAAQSWVWQYAPEATIRSVGLSDRIRGRLKSSGHGYPFREGLIAYIGCASTGNHMTNFRAANDFLAESALDYQALQPHIDLFERYLLRWKERQ